MLDRFLYYNFSLFEEKKIVLACSGGIDSMVLLHLLQQIDCNLIVCYIDHLTRNGQSTHDKYFIKQYCTLHKIVFYSADFLQTNGNFQANARAFRYQECMNLMHSSHADFIATAHHLDDDNENFFIRALRGTGLKGLTGMKAIDPPIVRPLLYFYKAEIEKYATDNLIPFIDDTSNASNIYIRNLLRNELFSKIEKLNPNTPRRIQQTISRLNDDHSLLHELIHHQKDGFIIVEDTKTTIKLDLLNEFKEGKTLLFHFLSPFGANKSQVEQIITADVGSIFSTGEYLINRDRDKIIIKPNTSTSAVEIKIPSEGNYQVSPGIKMEVEFSEKHDEDKHDHCIVLSFTRLTLPLKLRTWQPGDRFYPAGMKGKSKKVSKYLKDLKIPNIEKSEIFVLLSQNGNICGIPGYRADHRYLPDDDDKKVVIIKLIKEPVG